MTLCVFLGARHVVEIQEALLTSYPPTTPVAVAYRATWPDEELTMGTLADLVEMVQGPEYERTTLIIVGPSLQRHGKRSHLYDPSYWHLFRPEKRPAGTRVNTPSPLGWGRSGWGQGRCFNATRMKYLSLIRGKRRGRGTVREPRE